MIKNVPKAFILRAFEASPKALRLWLVKLYKFKPILAKVIIIK